jgi:hypothetical protein
VFFKVIYVNTIDEELIVESKRLFGKFEKFSTTYNGNQLFKI